MPEKLDRETKKEIAKIGMTAALGVTVITAPFLKGNRVMKNLHTGAGVALVALSLWHHFLYQPEKRKAKSEALAAEKKAKNTPLPQPAAPTESAPAAP
nr:hypothetical protein [uncultured Desulfobulbus sp.]